MAANSIDSIIRRQLEEKVGLFLNGLISGKDLKEFVKRYDIPEAVMLQICNNISASNTVETAF